MTHPNSCLLCYKPLEQVGDDLLHPECITRFFGTQNPSEELIESLTTQSNNPQYQDLLLHLAAAATIVVVEHTLYPTASGESRLLVKPFDVDFRGTKQESASIMEMLELSDEQSSQGSYEQAADMIDNYSTINKLDLINFWERVAFAWVVGANDWNLEDIKLYSPHKGMCTLTPLGSLRSATKDQELALTLNGKRTNLKRGDFERAIMGSGLKSRNLNQIFKKFNDTYERWCEIIDSSHMERSQGEALKRGIGLRLKKMELGVRS